MFACSKQVYIKKSLKQQLRGETEEIKEEDWDVDSDSLNNSFDSSDDEDEKPIQQSQSKHCHTHSLCGVYAKTIVDYLKNEVSITFRIILSP